MQSYTIFSDLIKYLIIASIAVIASLVMRIFTTLAIGEDAKAIGVKDRTVYMILAFFFPPIVAIVYLCTRKKAKKIQPKMCDLCGLTVDTTTTICPKCSGVLFTDYIIPGNEKHKKNAKLFTTIAAIALSIIVVLNVCSSMMAESFVNDLRKYSNDNGYSQYFDDYFNDYFDDFDPYAPDDSDEEDGEDEYENYQDYFEKNFDE